MKTTVRELAARLQCVFEGDGSVEITGVAGLEEARAGDLVFLAQTKLRPQLEASRASAAIVPLDFKFDRLPVFRAAQPHLAFVRAAEIFFQPYRPAAGVHATAVVAPSAKIGAGAAVGAYCVIGEDAEIGEGAVLFPQVVVYPGARVGQGSVLHSGVCLREGVRLGARVILHNGVIVGADGFGYLRGADGGHIKIPQMGTVVIEDGVEVGANTTIDRAALGATIVRRGAIIDNLVMVAHNCDIGENAILVSQVGIAGSSKIGRGAVLSGQVGVGDHIEVGEGAVLAGKTGVISDVPAGAFLAGYPHLDIRVWRKFWAVAPQLYDMVKEIKRLRARVEELEKKK